MKHLDDLLESSVVMKHDRGIRRYFPIQSKDITSSEALDEAIFIITGIIIPKNDEKEANFQRGLAILNCIDKYIENWDGSLWVRTVYKV